MKNNFKNKKGKLDKAYIVKSFIEKIYSIRNHTCVTRIINSSKLCLEWEENSFFI